MKDIGKIITSLALAAALSLSFCISAYAYSPSQNNNSGTQTVQMADGQQPPAKPDGEQDSQQPPAKPDGEQDGQQPPAKPDGEPDGQQPPAKPDAEQNTGTGDTATDTDLTGTRLTSVIAGKGRKMTVKWKKSTTGEVYKIQYSRDKTFKKGVRTVDVDENTTVKTTIKSLKKGKYYVRVRTVDGENTSDWSGTKTVKIKK